MATSELEFAHSVNLHENQWLVAAIQSEVARMAKVEAETISSDTTSDELHQRMPVGWDETEFLIRLEDDLGQRIDMESTHLPPFVTRRFFFWKREALETFGEWIKQAVPEIKKHLVHAGER